MRGLFRPRATNGYELALAEQIMQQVGRFQSREAGRKRRPRSHMPACADHAHARCRTELCHFLANAAGADNTDGLVPDDYGIVSLMIEKMAPLVPIAQVQTAGKVKKACQHIFGHGPSVR